MKDLQADLNRGRSDLVNTSIISKKFKSPTVANFAKFLTFFSDNEKIIMQEQIPADRYFLPEADQIDIFLCISPTLL